MVDKLKQLLPEVDVNIICRIPTNKNLHDKWAWHWEKNGIYFVRNGYRAFLNNKFAKTSSSNGS